MQRGESVRLHVTVKNSGTGKALDTTAQLRNLSDEGVFINKGRFDLDSHRRRASRRRSTSRSTCGRSIGRTRRRWS